MKISSQRSWLLAAGIAALAPGETHGQQTQALQGVLKTLSEEIAKKEATRNAQSILDSDGNNWIPQITRNASKEGYCAIVKATVAHAEVNTYYLVNVCLKKGEYQVETKSLRLLICDPDRGCGQRPPGP